MHLISLQYHRAPIRAYFTLYIRPNFFNIASHRALGSDFVILLLGHVFPRTILATFPQYKSWTENPV